VRHRGRFAGFFDGPACLFQLRLELVDPPAIGLGIGGLIVGFTAGVNNAWRAIRAFSDDAAKGGGDRLP